MTAATQIEHRLTRLETRAAYTDRILDDRKTIIAAHSRRLADVERELRDLSRIQIENVERITRVEEQSQHTTDERRDERTIRKHRRALLQWMGSFALALAALAGLLSRGDVQTFKTILGGWLSLPS